MNNVAKEIEWNINQAAGLEIIRCITVSNEMALIEDMKWLNSLKNIFCMIAYIKKVNKEDINLLKVKIWETEDKLYQEQPKTETGKVFQNVAKKNIKRELFNIALELQKIINESEIIKFHVDWADPTKAVYKT